MIFFQPIINQFYLENYEYFDFKKDKINSIQLLPILRSIANYFFGYYKETYRDSFLQDLGRRILLKKHQKDDQSETVSKVFEKMFSLGLQKSVPKTFLQKVDFTLEEFSDFKFSIENNSHEDTYDLTVEKCETSSQNVFNPSFNFLDNSLLHSCHVLNPNLFNVYEELFLMFIGQIDQLSNEIQFDHYKAGSSFSLQSFIDYRKAHIKALSTPVIPSPTKEIEETNDEDDSDNELIPVGKQSSENFSHHCNSPYQNNSSSGDGSPINTPFVEGKVEFLSLIASTHHNTYYHDSDEDL